MTPLKLINILLMLSFISINAQENREVNQDTTNGLEMGIIISYEDKKTSEKNTLLLNRSYFLDGRALTKQKDFNNECKEYGQVAVRIEVARNGNVKNALPGIRNTTTASPCLYELAKKKALSMVFNSDDTAPKLQVGSVLIKFKDQN